MEGFFSNTSAVYLLIPALGLVIFELFFRRQHWFLVLSRSVWISLLVLLLADWTLTLSRQYSEAGDIYLVYDRSDSMASVESRRARVESFVDEAQAWASSNKQSLKLYSIADDLQVEDVENLRWGGARSKMTPLKKLMNTDKASIIFLSDGVLDEGIRSRIPFFSIQMGLEEERDVWIDKLSSVVTAFLKNRVEIPFSIAHKGFEGEEIEIQLKKYDSVLQSKKLVLDDQALSSSFSYFPEKMGEEVLSLEIKALDGELSSLNNTSHFRLRTVRDKIRVLHINGKPSLDLKAWRLFLTRQPDVDLVSFYILRSPADDPQAKNRELSLIPFPYEDLFTSELEKFDIVVLQNFNFNLYFSQLYLKNLAAFVRQGGSLLIFGGDQSFQNYRFSPLEPLFPFRFTGPANLQTAESSAILESKHPLVEDIGWAFETLRWNNFHSIATKTGATDLVRLSNGVPFLSMQQAGDGRVMAFNTDESWRLQFQAFKEFSPFSRMARRVLQYLTFDPEMDPKRILSTSWRVGESVELSLADESFADWKVRGLYAGEVIADLKQQKALKINISRPDIYEVRINDEPEGVLFETEEQPWRGEWVRLISQNERLERISDLSQGRFFSYEDRAEVFDQGLGGRQVIAAETSPWTRAGGGASWLFLVACLMFLSLDFYLRKRYRWDA